MTLSKLQYERERTEFGDEVKTLRKSKRLTGVILAAQTGISQSKLSKIETGALIPSTDDLRKILIILKASQSEGERLVEWARALRTEFVSWRFEHRQGLAAKQLEVGELERQAKRIRVFQTAAIPGLLQVPAYAKCILQLANVTHQLDLENAVAARIRRQQILYETERQFEFVITEGAALSRFCEPHIVIQQLDRIRFLFGLPNIKIGFLSNKSFLPRVPMASFVIHDSRSAVVETLTGEFPIEDQACIATYNEAFDDFASTAVFGVEADPILEEWKHFLSMHTIPSGVSIHESSACS